MGVLYRYPVRYGGRLGAGLGQGATDQPTGGGGGAHEGPGLLDQRHPPGQIPGQVHGPGSQYVRIKSISSQNPKIQQGRPFPFVSKFVHSNHRLERLPANQIVTAREEVDTLKAGWIVLVNSYIIKLVVRG